MSEFEKTLLDSPTSAKLRLYTMLGKGKGKAKKVKGVVQISHGMAEHAGRYERFAKFLAKNGYHTVASDHRGHGETVCYGAREGMFASKDGLPLVIEDMAAVTNHIKEAFPGLPVIFFGHSMGAILGVNYCIDHSDKIDAAALWNSGVDAGALLVIYKFLLKVERMLRGSDTPSFIASKLTFEDWNKKFAPNRTEFDWLSRDEKEVDKYIDDPMCGFKASNGLWTELTKSISIGADDRQLAKVRYDLPINLLAGGKDPCSDFGKAVERLAHRFNKAQIADISCIIHPENRHEALNEINRDETMHDFVHWLDERFT